MSTYNQPKWLDKVLVGYEQQLFKDFEIIIADDGSTYETASVIKKFQKQSKLKITHIWQEDNGFQKTKILNKAILASSSDYLLITDGDCIPRNDFVLKHFQLRKPSFFLSGGYYKLPNHLSQLITHSDIVNQLCFEASWLLKKGLKKSFKLNKLTSFGTKEKLLNTFTPTKATWDGMNASGWKKDILAVNGFDERMAYGGEDRELGERMMNNGVKAIQIRYSAICVHLFHDHNYKDEANYQRNLEIRKNTKKENKVWTDYGVIKS